MNRTVRCEEELATQCAASCANCVMELLGSSEFAEPKQYCRTGAQEDPWISAGDHPDKIVYGENGDANQWHTGTDGSIDALNTGGSNVSWFPRFGPRLLDISLTRKALLSRSGLTRSHSPSKERGGTS